MIDIKLLASAHERVTYQLERANVHIDGVGNEHIAVLLDAAKAYQSAVASKDEVEAATEAGAWAMCADAGGAGKAGGCDPRECCCYRDTAVVIPAALTAAKIKVAHRINTDTLAGFDGGYDAGWQDAIEACAELAFEQKYKDTGPRAVEIVAIAIRALKPPGD